MCKLLKKSYILSNTYVLTSVIDEFCDGFPHNLIPTPGYWIECSRAISNQGSAWTNEERDLQGTIHILRTHFLRLI